MVVCSWSLVRMHCFRFFLLICQCSEEVVVLGILRVVEEILEQRPNAKVVINSILPMTSLRGGLYPVISDYEDSFGRTIGGDGQRYLSETVSHNRALWFGRTKADAESTPAEPAKTTQQSESDAATAAATEREEKLRDEPARKDQSRNWLRPAVNNNPIMEDKEKVKKYELGRNFVHRSAQPFWTSIKAINRELKKFAEKQPPDRVIFFDATSLFTAKEGKQYTLLTDLLTVRGHPTEKGFAIWEDAIVDKVQKILNIGPKGEGRPGENVNYLHSSLGNETAAGDSTTHQKPPDLIVDDLPEDDELDDKILHHNDDQPLERMENGFSVEESEDGEDDEVEDDRDNGELFVPPANNRGGGARR